MPKTKISEYSTTNSNNTDIESINIDEGCAPSGINNAIRELMVHLKEFQTGSSGDPLTVAGGFVASGGFTSNTMTVTGILTASGGTILSSTNTLSGSNIISGNINSSGTTNTFSGGNILSGTNTFSGTNIFSSDVTLNAQSDLRFADSDSSNWVALQAPATVASNVTWTLPAADGTSNQALVTNGSGTLSWATAGGGNDSFKNRIINGDMRIDQRNAGASVTPANEAYTLDRWSAYTNGAGVYTVQQSSTAPAGFVNSLLCTVTTVDSSVSGSDYYMLQQRIEGLNVSDLGWGTADAKTVTISFWVRSSITGTYTVKLGNSAPDRSYVATYSISSANTWEQKTITIAGDTSGTWLTTNGIGIEIRFALAIGSSFTTSSPNQWLAANVFGSTTASNNWIGTNGATFYITGVQLEVGSGATAFERIDYGRGLMLCYRYFQKLNSPTAYGYPGNAYFSATGATNAYGTLVFIIPMRAAPTLSATGNLRLVDQTLGSPTISALTGDAARTSTYSTEVQATVSSGLTQYRTYWLQNNNDTTASVNLTAEL